MCAALLPCSSRLGAARTQLHDVASCSYLVPPRRPMRRLVGSSVQQPHSCVAPRCTRACAQPSQQQHARPDAEPDHYDTPLPFSWQLWVAITSLPCGPALADEALKYNPAGGETLIKTLTGIFYIGLVGYFLYKVLNRRARTAREERIAGQGPVETPFTRLIDAARAARPSPKATPVTALIGAVQAGGIAVGLWIFTSKVEAIIGNQSLPPGYTAGNVAITVRTIILGLLYLVTFIFSANTLGLTALAVALVVDPKSVEDPERPERPTPTGPVLPKVTVTSSTDDIRAAFNAVAKSSSTSTSTSSSSTNSSSSGGGSSGSSGSGSSSSGAVAAGNSSGTSSQQEP